MRFLRKLFTTIFFLVIAFLIAGWYVSYKYSDSIKQIVLTELNNHLNAEVNVEAVEFSSLKKIPYLSLSFSNVLVKESKTYSSNPDTLLFAETLSFQFDIWDVYNGNYELKHLDVESAKCYMKHNKTGTPNYQVWKETADTNQLAVSLKLDEVNLSDIVFSFKDKRNKVYVKTKVNELKVSGDFTAEQLELLFKGSLNQSTVLAAGVYALRDQNIQVNSGIIYHNEESTFELQNGAIVVGSNLKLNLGGFVAPNSYQFAATTDKANLGEVLNLLPKSWDQYWEDYKPNGTAKIDFKISGSSSETPKIDIDFDVIDGRMVTKGKKPVELKNLNLTGNYTNGKRRNARSSKLVLSKAEGAFPSGAFFGSVEASNFSDLRITGNIEGELAVNELIQFLQIETIEQCSGKADFKLSGDIFWDKILEESVVISKSKLNGKIQFTGVALQLKASQTVLKNYQGKVTFDKQMVRFEKSEGQLNSTNFILNGSADNFFQWVLEDDEVLRVAAQVKADNLKLEEFLVASDANGENKARTLAIPGVELQLSANIDRLSYEEFLAEKISTKLFIGQKSLKANPVTLNAMGGQARGKLALVKLPSSGYMLSFMGDFESVNIQSLFKQFKNFGQKEIKSENIEGIADLKLTLDGKVSDEFELYPASVLANADLDISKGKLINYGTLQSISDYFKTNVLLKKVFHADELSERLKTVSFERLENTLFIRNSALYIPKVQLKSSVLNVNVSGKHSFNDSIAYKVDFDISDLLVKDRNYDTENGHVVDDGTGRYRVFLDVTGTTEHLNIEMDKESKKEYKKHQRKNEGKEFKQALHKEFGWFSKDTSIHKEEHKTKFDIEWEEADDDTTTYSKVEIEKKQLKKKKGIKGWLEPNEEEKEFFEFKDDDF